MSANPIDDDFNQSPEDLAIWLDRKYARHGEDEDRQAAAMLRQYAALTATQQQGQAVAWVRYRSDGGIEGPVLDQHMDDIRRNSGAWTPLGRITAPPPSVPEGWVLVPAEPTDEMVEAAWDSDAADYVGEHKRIHSLGLAWSAMIAAAPSAQEDACESRADGCGPVTRYDDDGIGLCERCARDLGTAP